MIELNGLLNAELYASDPVLVVQALVCRRHVKTDPVAAGGFNGKGSVFTRR